MKILMNAITVLAAIACLLGVSLLDANILLSFGMMFFGAIPIVARCAAYKEKQRREARR